MPFSPSRAPSRLAALACSSLAAVLAVGLAPALTPAQAAPAPPRHAGAALRATTTHHSPVGLPAGAPDAARRPEPTLRTPQGWPFQQRLSRTFGTGRLFDGGSYWSDFVYDDHGAAVPSGFSAQNTASLAPYQGVYTYPAGSEGTAHGNGADVFVAATAVDAHASYWRVDFNTLTDPSVPLAVWTFDTDGDASTGVSQWPADAHVTSPGIDRALVVSSRGAWLEDLRTGRTTDVTTHGGALSIDRGTSSFVVRVPTSLMKVSGRWKVRLGTGLAAPDGRTLAAPTISGLPTLPTAARLYNVAFRTAGQEPAIYTDSQTAGIVAAYQALAAGTPPFDQLGADGQARFVTGNFWGEDHQADALATGDVAAFSRTIDWTALRHRAHTPEPLVHGESNRWYVSRLHLGHGVVENPTSSGTGDGRPNFLGKIQPYAVYVPDHYTARKPAPLTWILHSLSVNHNQYTAYDPLLLQQLCERRDSICATTLGYGPDGWFYGESEVDYWAVWGALAHSYALDPTRTVISGYSMGGWATYHLGLAHPDLYAAAVTLAGPPHCGVSLDDTDQTTQPAFGGRCTTDGSSVPLIGNARWLPFRIGQGTVDELVPFTSVENQVKHFQAKGLRFRFVRYPGEDHLVFATQDRFASVVQGLGTPQVPTRPRSIDFTWRPHLTQPKLGVGVTTAYWLSGLGARRAAPGTTAQVRANSSGIRGRAHRVLTDGPTPITSPLPAVRVDQTWKPGKVLPHSHQLVLRLRNVSRISVDMRRAGLTCGVVAVHSDGPVLMRLTHLPVGQRTFRLSGSSVQKVHLAC